MSEYKATVEWKRATPGFEYRTYNRSHTLAFEGGISVPASAAPWNMPAVTFSGTPPTPEQFAQLHEMTHQRCFIANSVKTEIVLEPRIA